MEASANVLKGNLYLVYLFRSSAKVPFVNEAALERESNEFHKVKKAKNCLLFTTRHLMMIG